MALVIKQFEIYLVSLDPAQGCKIKKTRPCVVISPNEMNVLRTVLIAPMTTQGIQFPTRIALEFQGKKGQIVLDQIRAIDKTRLVKCLGVLKESIGVKILQILQQMFALE